MRCIVAEWRKAESEIQFEVVLNVLLRAKNIISPRRGRRALRGSQERWQELLLVGVTGTAVVVANTILAAVFLICLCVALHDKHRCLPIGCAEPAASCVSG
jgi:hypothetical protein